MSNALAKATIAWCAGEDPGHASLKTITQPTLIVHGSDTAFVGNALTFLNGQTIRALPCKLLGQEKAGPEGQANILCAQL